MLKRSLIAVVAVAVLATVAQAGMIKTHDWPTTYVPQELTTIPVFVDVGYYVEVLKQTENKIKMTQTTATAKNFSGFTNIKVRSNFPAQLGCSITPTGDVSGKNWSCSLDPSVLDGTPGDKTIKVTASVEDLAIDAIPAGTEKKVANVKITVIPQ